MFLTETNPLDEPKTDPFEVARTAAAEIADRTGVAHHDIALTLGSGWGKAADLIGETTHTIAAQEITGFSAPALDEGVYCQFRGPHYETPAEVQMAKAIGGHIVGMSTALEAIAARQAGMEILGMSLITNLAAGISPTPLSHQEVIEAGAHAEPVISALLARIVAAL